MKLTWYETLLIKGVRLVIGFYVWMFAILVVLCLATMLLDGISSLFS
jgi:hypothetical protein